MKVSKLKLENIKSFKKIEILFEDSGQLKDWSLIAGENGQGKTTILRSLAVGLCDQEGVSAILADLFGDGFVRNSESAGFIEVVVRDSEGNQYTIKTIIQASDDNESVTQEVHRKDELITEKDFRPVRKKIFAVAYGAGRIYSKETISYERYALVDAVYNLFSYSSKFQNPELGARRLVSGREIEKLENLLKDVLMLPDEARITLEPTGMYFYTPKWGKVSFDALSDGYQSLTTVVIDFLSWGLLRNPGFSLEDDSKKISCIFIIDEIEQHLHPKWQKGIIKKLAEVFPNVQFIGSTHTPICALGLQDLDCKSQLIKTFHEDEEVKTEPYDLANVYKGYRVDQILTSSIFELQSAKSKSVEDELEAYRNIYLKEESQRTNEEKNKMKQIEFDLRYSHAGETFQDEIVKEKLTRLLEENKKS